MAAADQMGGGESPSAPGDYPLKNTAALLNDRLGLYLSNEQQRGLATGLMVGVALGAAVLAWSVGSSLRKR